MQTAPLTPADLAASVIAVPPLARSADLSINNDQNAKMIRHLEAGSVNTLLYGGNAAFYHIALREYEELLASLAETAAPTTRIIPSVGPAFGLMMDQAAILRQTDYPTAMILPQKDVTTEAGVETGTRKFVEFFGRPAILYIKIEGVIEVPAVKRLVDDGLIAAIKYAIVRDDPAQDEYLERLVDAVDPQLIVSGIGEQPAIVHLNQFGLNGFTSGCVCINPQRSADMLTALKNGDIQAAETIRQFFKPLEDLRNEIHPIRVLHEAVRLAGIADTGPITPLLSNLDPADHDRVRAAAQSLLA